MSNYTYENRKKNGLCPKCGEKNDNGKVYCDSCRLKIQRETKEAEEFAKSIGICPRCRRNKLFGDEKYCPECRAYKTEQVAKSRKKNPERHREVKRRSCNRLRQERREKGICIECGKRKAMFDGTRCEYCRAKTRNRRALKRIMEIKEDGCCRIRSCKNKAMIGYRICEEHYGKICNNGKTDKANEARKYNKEKLLY